MHDAPDRLRWVLLVTNGMSMAFPGEVYADERVAEREGVRWAWTLSDGGRVRSYVRIPGRWEIGETWVRLVEAVIGDESPEVWIGTHWARDGYPEPEAALFSDPTEAREWAITPSTEGVLSAVHEARWLLAATFKVRGGEEHSVVQLAKVVS